MDLGLFLRVIWRFRVVVTIGLIFAMALAFLSFVKVSFNGGSPSFTYRASEEWRSDAKLFVTQPGFPWGQTITEYLPSSPDSSAPAVPIADPGRLSTLTALYAELANSDEVRRLMLRDYRPDAVEDDVVKVTAVPAPQYSTILPLLKIEATSDSPSNAVALANRASQAFRTWLERRQNAAQISGDRRVLLDVVNRASEPVRVSGRGRTLPIVVFLTVMTAILGLVFILENLRPRIHTIRDQRTYATGRSA
jgi:capsular polysaccharide biosynthesis protein